MKILTIKLKILMGLLSLCFAVGAQASLSEFQTFTGNVGLSTDGFGSISEAGVISASVPAGSTVIAAFLYSATNNTNATPTITLDGSAVALGPRVANATACCSLASFRADVTSIVKPIIDAGPGGVYNFNITEGGALISQIDGEVLIVVYENASLGISTIGILDGFASVSGDVATISYAEALDPSEAGFLLKCV